MTSIMEHERLKVSVSYPNNPDYEYETGAERIDLDRERRGDIATGRGFIVSPPQGQKKDLKFKGCIFDTRFGNTLSDVNPYIDKYKCECGTIKSRVNNGIVCNICNTPVKFVDDDFSYFGWITLDKYYIIHPNIYMAIASFIGKDEFDSIIDIEDEKDENGHSVKKTTEIIKQLTKTQKRLAKIAAKRSKISTPYKGMGMIDFYEKFDEVMEYYRAKHHAKPKKVELYNDIMRDREKVFAQSIPVYSTHLRPYDINAEDFSYEDTNGVYYLMAKLAYHVNNDSLKMFRKKKSKDKYLYELQKSYISLNELIDKILSGKKGNIRLLTGGRYNMAARCVIVQNPRLRIDQITLPYFVLVEILQQQIVNVLQKTYNYSFDTSYNIWYAASIAVDDQVVKIVKGLMYANPEGLPFIINRNPTIDKGGTLQVFCVEMTFDFTMAISLQILTLLAADFDGDVLNILYIISKLFYMRSNELLNPRNSAYISNNDGRLNKDVIPKRDTLINLNTLLRLNRHKYTETQLKNIERIKMKWNQV